MNPLLQRPARVLCRSGFTREYGSGRNGERRVEIGQQARPFRG
ncbi:diguanylate phosphodiesterase [Pseudomonas putida]|nr:diguanylate phosphodiesterase [Pseudomonas putida]